MRYHMVDHVGRKSILLPVVGKRKVTTMKKLDFNNSLYYLLMDHAGISHETDGQRLSGCSVDQMFDDLLRDQEQPEPLVFTDNYNKRGNNNDK